MFQTTHASCNGSVKIDRFGYQRQAALALIGPIYDTLVEYPIFDGNIRIVKLT